MSNNQVTQFIFDQLQQQEKQMFLEKQQQLATEHRFRSSSLSFPSTIANDESEDIYSPPSMKRHSTSNSLSKKITVEKKITKRSSRACVNCRRIHFVCDGQIPCHSCSSKGIESQCHYEAAKKRGPKPKGEIEENTSTSPIPIATTISSSTTSSSSSSSNFMNYSNLIQAQQHQQQQQSLSPASQFNAALSSIPNSNPVLPHFQSPLPSSLVTTALQSSFPPPTIPNSTNPFPTTTTTTTTTTNTTTSSSSTNTPTSNTPLSPTMFSSTPRSLLFTPSALSSTVLTNLDQPSMIQQFPFQSRFSLHSNLQIPINNTNSITNLLNTEMNKSNSSNNIMNNNNNNSNENNTLSSITSKIYSATEQSDSIISLWKQTLSDLTTPSIVLSDSLMYYANNAARKWIGGSVLTGIFPIPIADTPLLFLLSPELRFEMNNNANLTFSGSMIDETRTSMVVTGWTITKKFDSNGNLLLSLYQFVPIRSSQLQQPQQQHQQTQQTQQPHQQPHQQPPQTQLQQTNNSSSILHSSQV